MSASGKCSQREVATNIFTVSFGRDSKTIYRCVVQNFYICFTWIIVDMDETSQVGSHNLIFLSQRTVRHLGLLFNLIQLCFGDITTRIRYSKLLLITYANNQILLENFSIRVENRSTYRTCVRGAC